MTHRLAPVLGILVLLSACTASETDAPTDRSSPSVGGAAGAPVTLPAPDDALPSSPEQLASALEHTTLELRSAIDAWIQDPGTAAPPPRDARLLALHQYRLTTSLVTDPSLYDRTAALLPREIAGQVRANVEAGREIRSLVTPIEGESTLRTQRPESAGALLGYYREAQDRFGVDWEMLAALNFIESRFGRARSPSSAGARGPMQFIPDTWAAYGMGGDIDDPHDAILGAANFLRSGGAPERYRRALYYYNHSWAYVRAVMLYARQIMRDPRSYLAYYNWPVVVVTTEGEQFLTGPGSR